MFFKCILTSLLIGTYKGQPAEKPTEECCRTKEVGGVGYVLVSEGDVPEPCLSGCIYQQDGMPGSKYCFARGSLPVTCGDQTCTQSGRYEGNISKTFQYSGNFSRCNKTCIAPECKFWTYEFSTFGLPPLPPGNCTQFSSVSKFIPPPPGGNGRVAFISSDPTCQPGFYDGTEVANFKVFPSNENVCVRSCSNTAACNFWSYGVPAMKPPPIGYCRLFSSVSKYIHQLIGVNWSSGETSHKELRIILTSTLSMDYDTAPLSTD